MISVLTFTFLVWRGTVSLEQVYYMCREFFARTRVVSGDPSENRRHTSRCLTSKHDVTKGQPSLYTRPIYYNIY